MIELTKTDLCIRDMCRNELIGNVESLMEVNQSLPQ